MEATTWFITRFRSQVVLSLIVCVVLTLAPAPSAQAEPITAMVPAGDAIANDDGTLQKAGHAAGVEGFRAPYPAVDVAEASMLPSGTTSPSLTGPQEDTSGADALDITASLSTVGADASAAGIDSNCVADDGEGDGAACDIPAHAGPRTAVHLPLVLNARPIRGDGPGAIAHVVQRSQTLARIARQYGTTVAAIMRANDLTDPDFIWVGQRLYIPGNPGDTGRVSSQDGTVDDPSARWIEVILGSQRTIAWQGHQQVRTMVVSTGTSHYPTPTGQFHVYAKYPSVTMSGPGYHLPGVPHTMFFHRSYAIHGTYWHNNFGHPMSHGCVNLTEADAAWLYRWAPAGIPVIVRD
jgi:lipoprotein-anchoring transpeptidase ErfK/SrfK